MRSQAVGWFEFSLAYEVFFPSHSIPVHLPLRPFHWARLGKAGFTLVTSVLSLGVLA